MGIHQLHRYFYDRDFTEVFEWEHGFEWWRLRTAGRIEAGGGSCRADGPRGREEESGRRSAAACGLTLRYVFANVPDPYLILGNGDKSALVNEFTRAEGCDEADPVGFEIEGEWLGLWGGIPNADYVAVRSRGGNAEKVYGSEPSG